VDQDIAAIVRERRIEIEFQPIVDVPNRAVFAHEALARGPAGSPLRAPLALFAAASSAGLLSQLELACLSAALRASAAAGLSGRLFLNISPHSLLSAIDWPRELETLCRRHAVEPASCVLELTEQSLLEDFERIRATLQALRALGFDFAIDDFGTGYSGLRTWSELRPDFVKIDRYFAQGVERDPVKLAFVRSIIDMGRAVGSRVIIEGVESLEECRELVDLDVDGVQGFLFGRPQALLRSAEETLAPLRELHAAAPPSTAGDLAVEVAPVHPAMQVSAFVRLVQERSHCAAFPVVDDAGVPVGIIWRDRFLVTYSKPLHPEVLAKKPLSAIMDATPLVVDARLRIEQTSRLVTRKSRIHGTDQFIIVREGRYAGVGHTIDLLTHITHSRIQAATHCNPLTTLPGNVPIHDNVERIIQQDRPFVVAYADLDNFKPFNDHYGYAKGDQVLLQLAQVLVSSIARRTDFVGHIGGDDFVVILRSPDWAARLARVVEEFAARVHGVYSSEDLARGGIEAFDRNGERRTFRLLSLSIAVLDSRSRRFRSAEEVSEHLQAAKRHAKAVDGNCLWYEGPQGGRNLLEDPQILSQSAVPPPPQLEMDVETGTFELEGRIAQAE
jgi:EAL domain-containing protein (putative c-di-GMP-specific phosphodiesterase class I)/GGDEF domain-containing protein